MPNYWPLKYFDKPTRTRAINNLEALREQIQVEMPTKTDGDTLVLGSWNIRNFDDNRFMNGPRLKESLHYIAEVISAFDILAVQEINDDLKPLKDVIRILGENYDFIITDVTEGASGNRERLGIIYNSDKVYFEGIAGEIVLPEKHLISKANERVQFARTPFACSFQSSWFKFTLATVHIYYGSADKKSEAFKRRVEEIDAIAEFLSERADEEDYNYILVGDFNIEDFEDDTFNALEKHGFTVFKNKIGSNQKLNKFYDQISFKTRENELKLAETDYSAATLHYLELLQTDFTAYYRVLEEVLNRNVKATKEAQDRASAREETLNQKIRETESARDNTSDKAEKSRLRKQLRELRRDRRKLLQKQKFLQNQQKELEEVMRKLQGAAADSNQCIAKVFDHLSHNFASYRDELPGVLSERLKILAEERDQTQSQRAKNRLQNEMDEVDFILSNLHDRSHGVLNLFKNLFSEKQFEDYRPEILATIDKKIQADRTKMDKTGSKRQKARFQKKITGNEALKLNTEELKKYYMSEWRTYQFSDHFPLWVELKIDFSAEYLEKLKQRD